MSRILAIDPAQTTGKTSDLLAAVGKALGVVPNLFKVAAQSPAALEGLISLNGALQHGKLPGRTRESIALAIAQFDRCDYCLSAHTLLGKGAGLSEADTRAARDGQSSDERTGEALRLARAVAAERGHIANSELEAARRVLSDGEIVEVVALVALNVLTNYLNSVAATDIDFPEVHHDR